MCIYVYIHVYIYIYTVMFIYLCSNASMAFIPASPMEGIRERRYVVVHSVPALAYICIYLCIYLFTYFFFLYIYIYIYIYM